LPPGTGRVVAAEWDFEGDGSFPVKAEVSPQAKLTLTARYRFTKPGTYFPALRVASEGLAVRPGRRRA